MSPVLSMVFALAMGAGDLTVSVLTFGPGDHPFFKFGHNAVWIHDDETKRDLVYNYGMFVFDSPMLIPEFLKGKLRYWLARDTLGNTVANYRFENRTMVAQELVLSQQEAQQVAEALAVNARPENRYYKYDYYLDNCSTRVRDVVDRAIGGALQAGSRAPAEMTWRMHTRRLTQDSLLVYLALDIVMGDFIDRPIDQWEEMFLPGKLQQGLQRATRDGAPVIKRERSILDAPGRPPPPAAPPRWHLWFLLAGALAGGAWQLRRSRAIYGMLAFFAGLFGFFGCTFVMFWVATDHQVAHGNENIFLCAPWAIAFFGLMPGLIRRNDRRRTRAAQLALGAAVFSVLGLVAKVLPMMDQQNVEFICFFVPFWAGAAWGLRRG